MVSHVAVVNGQQFNINQCDKCEDRRLFVVALGNSNVNSLTSMVILRGQPGLCIVFSSCQILPVI